MKIYKYKTIDSTNTEAKRILSGKKSEYEYEIENLELIKYENNYQKDLQKDICSNDNINNNDILEPFVIISNEQTAGRGRLGRVFYSPADTGVYMSLVISCPKDINETLMITVKTAVAVHEAIKSIAGIDTGIKWVNDIYYKNRKVCGILAEMVNVSHNNNDMLSTPQKYIIIGIGINISTDTFPNEISEIAGSIGCTSSVEEMKLKLIRQIALNILTEKYSNSEYMKIYKEKSILLGKEVFFAKNGDIISGIAMDIDQNGALIIKTNDNIHVIQSGEVSVRLNDDKHKKMKYN